MAAEDHAMPNDETQFARPHCRPVAVDVFALAVPAPLTMTPLGPHRGRQAVLVRVRDEAGREGWGEVWCNFPAGGAAYRAMLVRDTLAPLLLASSIAGPAQAFAHLTAATHLLALQCGEEGPVAQAIAGLDIALWDLAARQQNQPLWRLLGGAGEGSVPAYASGMAIERAPELIAAASAAGHTAFKFRIWGGIDSAPGHLERARDAAAGGRLMIDANQSWSEAEAAALLPRLAPFELGWVEEPVPADAPPATWQRLAALSPAPLAGGENIRGDAAFDQALALGALGVVQPDMCKWGGVTACLALARRIRAAGRTYCPHYLGGGIGLLASAHLLAAVGGDGLLECDATPNPLRDELVPLPSIAAGRFCLPDAPGLGLAPDPAALARHALN